jgi:CO/xanthine dehydrogenase Mo-binding subunit
MSAHTTDGCGLGEGIIGAATGALTNAVCDALRPFGIEIDEFPLRPDREWRALREAKQPAAAE